MTIDSASSARRFIAAWKGHAGAKRAYSMAAESQRSCAILSGPNQIQASKHLAAATVLDRAAARLGQR